jgi:predicted amidohydrolase
MEMTIRVAALQVALGKGSYRIAVEDTQTLIRQAANAGAQIVCLPEHWLLEYGEQGYTVVKELAETARSERVYVISGANYTPIPSAKPEEIRIRSFLISPGGQIVGQQDKVHLFQNEKNVATTGDGYEIFETPLGKIGICICYDNVFPEASRTLVLRGADLLFVPSRIISEGVDPWILYLRTRALENRVPVVAPNIFHPARYVGGSVIIDLVVNHSSPVVSPRITASA